MQPSRAPKRGLCGRPHERHLMAFDRTALLEAAEPALYDRGWTTAGVTILFAIAAAENVKRRKAMEKMELASTDSRWGCCWCRAWAANFAYRKNDGMSTIRAALARAEYEGLIEVVRRGPNRTAFRRLNVPALTLLWEQLPKHPDYAAEMEKRKTPQPMDYLKLIGKTVQIPDWISDHMQGWLSAVKARGVINLQFPNVYERDLANSALLRHGSEGLIINRVDGSEADPSQQARRPRAGKKNDASQSQHENQRKVACLDIRTKHVGSQSRSDSLSIKAGSPKPVPFPYMDDDDGETESNFEVDHIEPIPSGLPEQPYPGAAAVPEAGAIEHKSVAYQLAVMLAEWRTDRTPDLARDASILQPLAIEGIDVVREVLTWALTDAFWHKRLKEVGAKMLRAKFGLIRSKMAGSRIATRATASSLVEDLEPIPKPSGEGSLIDSDSEDLEDRELTDKEETEPEDEADDPFFPKQSLGPPVLSKNKRTARRREMLARMNLPKRPPPNRTPTDWERRNISEKANSALAETDWRFHQNLSDRYRAEFLEDVDETLCSQGIPAAQRFIEDGSQKRESEFKLQQQYERTL
jgi:hypothetical protein